MLNYMKKQKKVIKKKTAFDPRYKGADFMVQPGEKFKAVPAPKEGKRSMPLKGLKASPKRGVPKSKSIPPKPGKRYFA